MHQIPLCEKSRQRIHDLVVQNQLDSYFGTLLSLSVNDLKQLLDKIYNDHIDSLLFDNELANTLLSDILSSLNVSLPNDKEAESESNSYSSTAFFLLACIAGLIFSFVDGLDGIVSILQWVPLSHFIFLSIVAFFSLLSVTVFLGFDVVEASNNLGFNFKSVKNKLEMITAQKKAVADIILAVEQKLLTTSAVDELKELCDLLEATQSINKKLDEQIQSLSIQHNQLFYLNIAKKVAAVLCCILFLSFGFFTGQVGALFLLGDITMKLAMSHTFSAFLTMSCAAISSVGCAAFYWMVQRPGVENLVSKLLYGFDEEAFEELNNSAEQEKISNALDTKLSLINDKKRILEDSSRQCQTDKQQVKSYTSAQTVSHLGFFSRQAALNLPEVGEIIMPLTWSC